jgi:uncharacterized protein YkwD
MGVRNRFVAVTAAILILLAVSANASASVACPGDEAQPTTATAYDAVMTLVCDINALRAQNGLRPLRWDWRLWYGAQHHAEDMATRHYFAHVSPEGRGLSDRITPTGYIPQGLGWTLSENLGFGTSNLSSPLAIAVGWMNSELHRKDMLDPDVDDIGVGLGFGPVSDTGHPGTIYVADFGKREEPLAAATPRVATIPAGRTGRAHKPAVRKVRPRGRGGRS